MALSARPVMRLEQPSGVLDERDHVTLNVIREVLRLHTAMQLV
ncbi:MAG: hypothetical protein M5U31_04930 [Acidimicrobiia bacterium]|nr:hypothetical protein [Acidimicrobiia bacterium]